MPSPAVYEKYCLGPVRVGGGGGSGGIVVGGGGGGGGGGNILAAAEIWRQILAAKCVRHAFGGYYDARPLFCTADRAL